MKHEFSIKIAGATGRVEALFESTPLYLGKYASGDAEDFSVTIRPEDLQFEADALYQEALEEGFRVRQFTEPFLERAAIQRAFAEFLFDRDVLMTHGSTVAVDGKAYHHIIDPTTLYPCELWRSVTVYCADSSMADALTTALFLMSREDGEALLESCDALALWVDSTGQDFYSPGLADYLK